MRIRSFIIAYVLIVAILLFADRRPSLTKPTHYSHVVDLTDGPASLTAASAKSAESKTRIIAPAALIPGTWTAGQIPQERLVAPLVVMDLHSLHLNTVDLNTPAATGTQISLDDIATWESLHGMIPAGSLIAIRRSDPAGVSQFDSGTDALPIEREAAQFLIAARSTIGFATETPVDFTSDRELARQLALHGNYVVESASGFKALPETGSLVIVAPAKNVKPGRAQVRILAMVH
jgi:kynurenine formamidase